MKNRFKRSTILPLALLIYLAVLAWIARGRFYSGDYLYYFGVIGGSLLIIVLLFIVLRKRDRLRQEQDEELYGPYPDKDEDQDNAGSK